MADPATQIPKPPPLHLVGMETWVEIVGEYATARERGDNEKMACLASEFLGSLRMAFGIWPKDHEAALRRLKESTKALDLEMHSRVTDLVAHIEAEQKRVSDEPKKGGNAGGGH